MLLPQKTKPQGRLLKARASRVKTAVLAALVGAAAVTASCKQPPFKRFSEGKTFAGGTQVDAHTLTEGHDSYMLYCYACHGVDGDGKGPSSYGLRPPPRNFKKAIFKFARMRSSDDLPTDEDFLRIIQGGLHGTAMLPWDVPEAEVLKIVQYIKTFADDGKGNNKWERKNKKTGEPVKTIDPFEPGADPWAGKEADAIQAGKELYHLRAECLNCHPGYDTKEALYKMSVDAAARDPGNFKAIGGFRNDLYHSVAKQADEYEQKIMPPDFLFTPVRSVRPKGSAAEQVTDLFRVLAYGVYPVMPAWKGAGLSDKDIWALAHYVKSLVDKRGTAEAADMKRKYEAQSAFDVPAKAGEDKPAEGSATEKTDAEKKDEGAKKDADKKKAEKKAAAPAPEKKQ